MMDLKQKRLTWVIGATLVLATLALYLPVLNFDFCVLDDPIYILQNPKVTQGVTGRGIVWAFTAYYGANWHPLTWISHMVDVSLFGFKPAGHHLVNAGLHAINAVLLFLLLRQITGALWRSALVAALFAWHPTHVESVAWVAERKDVLSTFFGLLTLIAYAAYAKARGEGREARGGTVWYGAALGLFACGLLSKPMLVTWPFVMLLLDFWPLNRITAADGRWQMADGNRKRWHYILLEKLPFIALTVGSCVLTFFAQRAGGAVISVEILPFEARIENAVVSYARYLGKTLWPTKLSAFYPHPVYWPDNIILLAVIILIFLSVLGLWLMRSQPHVLFGLCWFLGTLIPVIGLIQVGGQSIADRYLYIPQIGILIALVWSAAKIVTKYSIPKLVAALLIGGILIFYGFLTKQYLPCWQNSVLLFQHALKLNRQNPPALYSLGLALSSEGRFKEAIPYLTEAAELRPEVQGYQGQLALALENQGDIAGAIERYRKCIELDPTLVEALNNLAWLLATTPNPAYRNGVDAIRFATRACELTQNEWPMFLGTLAASYAEAGRFPEAIATAEKAEALARKRGFTELADRNAELLKVYRAGKPHRETATP